jgi:translation initiation factor 2 beta subunit (eIF-2beta)/eIF-5
MSEYLKKATEKTVTWDDWKKAVDKYGLTDERVLAGMKLHIQLLREQNKPETADALERVLNLAYRKIGRTRVAYTPPSAQVTLF